MDFKSKIKLWNSTDWQKRTTFVLFCQISSKIMSMFQIDIKLLFEMVLLIENQHRWRLNQSKFEFNRYTNLILWFKNACRY